jgi:hypothetical protein
VGVEEAAAPYAVALNVTSGTVGSLVLATMSFAAGHGRAGVAAANAGGATIAPATTNPVLSTSRRVSLPSMGHLPSGGKWRHGGG